MKTTSEGNASAGQFSKSAHAKHGGWRSPLRKGKVYYRALWTSIPLLFLAITRRTALELWSEKAVGWIMKERCLDETWKARWFPLFIRMDEILEHRFGEDLSFSPSTNHRFVILFQCAIAEFSLRSTEFSRITICSIGFWLLQQFAGRQEGRSIRSGFLFAWACETRAKPPYKCPSNAL